MRQLYTSKGFTFINGDTIVTGTIQSESGETYLDLKNGITHIGSTEKYIDYRNGEFKIKGNLVYLHKRKMFLSRLSANGYHIMTRNYFH